MSLRAAIAVGFVLAAGVVAQDDAAALVQRLGSDDAQVRSDAYNKLQRLRSPETMALLQKALPALPPGGRLFAIYLLDGYPWDESTPVWKKLVASDQPFVRVAAAAALWRRGDKSMGATIAAAVTAAPQADLFHVLGRLHGIEDPAVVAAVRGLVRPGVEAGVLGEALQHLLRWQKGRDGETVRAAEGLAVSGDLVAVTCLAYLVAAGEGRYAAALAVFVQDEKVQVHSFMRFLEMAARLEGPLVDAIVARLAQCRSEHDVTRLAQLLQKHAPHRVEEALRAHLDGGDARLRGAALKALAAVPGALDRKKLVAMLASDDPQVVLVAAETLRRMDDHAGLEPVLALVARSGKDRAEAVRVLGGFRDMRAVPPLLDAFGDADVQIRRNAISALQQLLPDLFPYRRFDLEKAGCRADGPDAQRAEGLRLLRAWWAAAK